MATTADTRAVRRRRSPPVWTGRAFGLEIVSPVPIPGIPTGGSASGGRAAEIRFLSPGELTVPRRRSQDLPVVDRRLPDGRPMMRIDRASEEGYRVWAPRHGVYLVSGDGRVVEAALPRDAGWRWQRLFFAQVLPLASALQGLDPFHASAVALGNDVIGFAAPSGTGKSSVAAHLVARGASLVTDDVLVLERAADSVRAHPGGGFLSVAAHEVATLGADARARLGRRRGRGEKLYFASDLGQGSLRLGAVYFLRRGGHDRKLTFQDRRGSAARLLLSASFLPYLRSEERLVTHLEVCAAIATSAGVYEVGIPAGVSAADTAAGIEEHARSARLTRGVPT